MAFLLIFFPLVMAGAAAIFPSNRWRPLFLPLTAIPQLFFTILILFKPGLSATNSWLVLDSLGKIVLLLVNTLFFFCSLYAVPYLQYRKERDNRVFSACMIAFAGTVSLVTCSQHLALMWVAIEATTLVTAPLIYFNRNRLCIEAMWKYLLISSVGIALALLGTFFLAYSSMHGGQETTLFYVTLLKNAPHLSKTWLHLSFVLLFIGYGTKMGLAPMHTWKPDSYGESPGIIGAILAGGLTSCAFLAFLRIYHICRVAGEFAYMSKVLLFMGLVSMATAAFFMINQRDLKRMLAYSSIEHMGILTIGLGIGTPALFGTLLHVIANGLTKGVLFLSVGNIHRAFGSKNIVQVRGALRLMPVSGSLFLISFLAITGSPPFVPFVSMFSILNGAFEAGKYTTAGLFLIFLLLVFIGMGAPILKALQGSSPVPNKEKMIYRDTFASYLPIIGLLILVFLFGVYIPSPLSELLNDAVGYLGGQP